MKNLFFIIGFLFIPISASYSQPNQGNFLIGLSSATGFGSSSDFTQLGFSSIKSTNTNPNFVDHNPDKIINLNLSPKVGYFIINHLVLGLNVNYSYSHYLRWDLNKYIRNGWLVGPFMRYYVPIRNLKLFTEGEINYGGIYKDNYLADNAGTWREKQGVSSWSLGLGIALPIGEKVAFDFMGGYYHYVLREKNEYLKKTIQRTLGIRIGFSFFIGGK